LSTFKQQSIGELLGLILNGLDLELIGIKIVDANKDLFK
jgi:hypothetical protein